MTPHLSKYTLRKVYSKIFHHFPRLAPRNYCQLTLKSRVISSKFGLSRHTYKKQGNEGLLYGVQKASW